MSFRPFQEQSECVERGTMKTFAATPIQKLKLDLNNNHFYVKRDDLFPISFGGNKARKAILFFEAIRQGSFDSVVTYGSESSNHCRVIANLAASYGIPCHIVTPDGSTKRTVNRKMVEWFGARIVQCPVSDVASIIDKVIEELKSEGFKPYFIEGGGHGNIGTQAYVEAYNEIRNYERETGTYFKYIFHASGTGTTQAGLICGKTLHGDKKEIVGISIARKQPRGGTVILESVNCYLRELGYEEISDDVVTFVDDFVLNGYGTYNDQIIHTIKNILFFEGIPSDPTYTGKAFWGMIEYIKKMEIVNQNILFIHTGGTPLFFDAMEEITNG